MRCGFAARRTPEAFRQIAGGFAERYHRQRRPPHLRPGWGAGIPHPAGVHIIIESSESGGLATGYWPTCRGRETVKLEGAVSPHI
jgi:hypothetical protein